MHNISRNHSLENDGRNCDNMIILLCTSHVLRAIISTLRFLRDSYRSYAFKSYMQPRLKLCYVCLLSRWFMGSSWKEVKRRRDSAAINTNKHSLLTTYQIFKLNDFFVLVFYSLIYSGMVEETACFQVLKCTSKFSYQIVLTDYNSNRLAKPTGKSVILQVCKSQKLICLQSRYHTIVLLLA